MGPSPLMAVSEDDEGELHAKRQGASESKLQEHDGSAWVALTDSGDPNYAYNGTGGSDTVTLEDYVVQDDSLGLLGVYDFIAEDIEGDITVTGTPGRTAVRVEDDDPTSEDAGLTPTTSSNYYSGLTLPGASKGSIAIYFTYQSSTQYMLGPADTSSAGFSVLHTASKAQVDIKSTTGTNLTTGNLHAVPTAGTRSVLVVEYDDDTPGSGTGTMKMELWRTGDGTDDSGSRVGFTVTKSYLTANADHDAGLKIGLDAGGTNGNSTNGLKINTFTGKLITDGDVSALADDTDETGGLTISAKYHGVRTGAYDETDTGQYLLSDGAGDDVVAST